MMRFAIFCCALAACVQSNKVVCGDLTCPADYQCDLASNRCISPEQLAACKDLPDGTSCTVSTAPGSCLAGVCEPLVCGDGIVSGAEECDGDNLNNQTCQDLRYYDAPGLKCRDNCTLDSSSCTGYCGDGVINGGELCDGSLPLGACYDFGYDAGPLGCSTACGAAFDQCARIGWQIEPIGVLHPNAGSATAHDDGWLVGDQGAIEHFNGVVWTAETSPVANTLIAVAALARDDVWAIGIDAVGGNPGVVIHRDASQWQVVAGAPAADYSDLCALGAGHIAIATNDQGVLLWDGAAWSTLGTVSTGIHAIRGTSPSDIWITHSDYSLWHWDGSTWSAAAVAGQVYSIAAVAPDDVWVIGNDPSFAGMIAHWDGQTWTVTTDATSQYSTVAASGPKDVWVSLPSGFALHFDGRDWSQVPLSFGGTAATIVTLGPGEAYAFEYTGFGYRYTGQALAHYDAITFGGGIRSMWSASATDILFAMGTGVYRFDGNLFPKTLGDAHGSSFVAIAGTGPNDIWATSNGGYVYHYDGTWNEQTAVGAMSDAIWAGGSEVWVFTPGVAHQGPPPWTSHAVPGTDWIAVAGDAANDLWGLEHDLVTASNVNLQHWNGSAWQTVTTPRNDLTAIGVLSSNDVWLATQSQHVLHWNGATWSDTPVTTLSAFKWIVPYASDDVFAASDLDVFHYDGTRWSRVRPDLDVTLTGNAITAVSSFGPGHFQYAHEQRAVRDLIRVEPWVCRAHETSCSDGIDDDCDGKIDGQDSDCP